MIKYAQIQMHIYVDMQAGTAIKDSHGNHTKQPILPGPSPFPLTSCPRNLNVSLIALKKPLAYQARTHLAGKSSYPPDEILI